MGLQAVTASTARPSGLLGLKSLGSSRPQRFVRNVLKRCQNRAVAASEAVMAVINTFACPIVSSREKRSQM